MIGRLLRSVGLAWTFLRISALNELQYRVNFFMELAQSLLALGTGLAVLALVFSHTRELAGWSQAELLAVMGVHILIGGVVRTAIQPNMLRLIEDIRDGKLDYLLTKPRDGQLLVSVRQLNVWQSVDCLVGAIVVGAALTRLQHQFGLSQALGFATALPLGVLVLYCFWLCLATGAFWVVRLEFIVELFDGIYQAGRWPVGIYPLGLRLVFTFLVPLGIAVTVPAQAIAGLASGRILLLAAGFGVVLLAITRWVWRRGLRRYSGASS